MWLCSKLSSFFSFFALPSGGKSKDAVVHWYTRKHFEHLSQFQCLVFSTRCVMAALSSTRRKGTAQPCSGQSYHALLSLIVQIEILRIILRQTPLFKIKDHSMKARYFCVSTATSKVFSKGECFVPAIIRSFFDARMTSASFHRFRSRIFAGVVGPAFNGGSG